MNLRRAENYGDVESSNERVMVLMVSSVPCVGGAEYSLMECAVSLAEASEFTPLVVCPDRGPLRDEVRERGIECEPVPMVQMEQHTHARSRLRVAVGTIMTALRIARVTRRSQACLIHANGLKAGLPVLLAAEFLRIPWVLHLRDYPRHRYLLGLAMSRANAIVATSEYLANAVQERSPHRSRSVAVIPNGVRTLSPSQESVLSVRREIGIDDDAVLVTMVAQIVPWKRQDLFLDAAGLASRHNPRIHFMLVGSDLWGLNKDYQKHLEKLAQQPDLKGKVSFLGNREDVGTLLSASDILVLSSQNEPFGRVVVEAWRVGTPVVVSDVGGPAEIVDHEVTGLHFQDGDASDLAQSIDRLASDRHLRRSLAEAAKKRANHYSVEAHASAMANLYRELLACG